MKKLLLAIAITGCSHAPSYSNKIEGPSEPLARESLPTVLHKGVDTGDVVSGHPSGDPSHRGEILLWLGIPLDAKYCGYELNLTIKESRPLENVSIDSYKPSLQKPAGGH